MPPVPWQAGKELKKVCVCLRVYAMGKQIKFGSGLAHIASSTNETGEEEGLIDWDNGEKFLGKILVKTK